MADMFLIGRYLRIFFSETAWPGELKLYIKPGVDPETLLTGGFSYGTIFSIIDGTNCRPRAVLACRSVNLVFISFSVQ